jgi:hypothetical protein
LISPENFRLLVAAAAPGPESGHRRLQQCRASIAVFGLIPRRQSTGTSIRSGRRLFLHIEAAVPNSGADRLLRAAQLRELLALLLAAADIMRR